MREIKFRAWDKKEGKWYEPVYEAYAGRLHDISISLHGQIQTRTLQTCSDLSDWQEGRYELMQFTGLKDKNGKDIWEGDVVRRNGNEDLKEISWNETQVAGFAYKDGVFYDGIIEPDDELEIIGNIYENPELLK